MRVRQSKPRRGIRHRCGSRVKREPWECQQQERKLYSRTERGRREASKRGAAEEDLEVEEDLRVVTKGQPPSFRVRTPRSRAVGQEENRESRATHMPQRPRPGLVAAELKLDRDVADTILHDTVRTKRIGSVPEKGRKRTLPRESPKGADRVPRATLRRSEISRLTHAAA